LAVSHGTEWFSDLQLALNKAKKMQKCVLFSEVKKMDTIDPLSFYQAGRERYAGKRFFWQDPAKEYTIAGLGKVEKIQANSGSTRFKEVEESWTAILQTAVKSGVTDVDATGPLLFGGFSFDTYKGDSRAWNQFGDNLFYIPAFMLSIVKGQAYLTTNVLCTPDDQATLFIEMINERDQLVENKSKSNNKNELIEQNEVDPDGWKAMVAAAVTNMKTSDIEKVVLARELRLKFNDKVMSENVVKNLLNEQPDSYIFSFESGSDCFIGATPERLMKKRGNELYSTCLAGSIARGKDQLEDEQLEQELLNDEKNRIEHQYVVSMITEALSPVCVSLHVPSEPVIMKNRHIQHLYTPVQGTCDENVSIFDIVDKLHPTPAMGGLPKEKAVVMIREIENLERGFYAAPLGWTDSYGNGEFAVGIRSALLQGREASLFAGCGLLPNSTPESEYHETGIKFNPMLSALGGNLHE
jgi:menaquinone-specific isochorismate synthase